MATNSDVLEMALSARAVNRLSHLPSNLPGLVVDLAQEKGYYFDTKKGEYVSRWNNRPVKDSTVLRAVEKYNSSFVTDNMQKHTDRFVEGKIDLPTWQKRMAGELKQGHVINATVGAGGRNNMDFSKWGRVGNQLRQQYNYLNNFAVKISTGQLTPGQIKYRVSMYAKSVRTSYFAGQNIAKGEAGLSMERRVTRSGAPCDPCRNSESRGWQPLGTLPKPGQDCKGITNCLCDMEYK